MSTRPVSVGEALQAEQRPTFLVKPAARHLPELDALRGLAALVVVLNHFHEAWLGTSHPAWLSRPRLNPVLWLLVDGHASVILFFLLSGFVLALPLLRGTSQPYAIFVVRRLCRIYLPYLAALCLAVVACRCLYCVRTSGMVVSPSWPSQPDALSLLQHILMVGRFDHYRYNGPVWSLVHEMRISLVFPVIGFLALRLRAAATFGLALLCAVGASVSSAFFEVSLPGTIRMTAWSLTLSYCGIFLLGAGLARRCDTCTRFVDRLPRLPRAALLLGGLLLYLYPPRTWRPVDIGDFVIACGGLVLLVFSLSPRSAFARFLRLGPMQFLGKVSYSLYLLHFPLLLAASVLVPRQVPFGLLLVPLLGISLAAAAAMHHTVELPAIALGKRLSRFRLPRLPRVPWALHRPQKAHL